MFQTAALKWYQKGLICSTENNYNKPVLFFLRPLYVSCWYCLKIASAKDLLKKNMEELTIHHLIFSQTLWKDCRGILLGECHGPTYRTLRITALKHLTNLLSQPFPERGAQETLTTHLLLSTFFPWYSITQLFSPHPGLPRFCFSFPHFWVSSHHSCGN